MLKKVETSGAPKPIGPYSQAIKTDDLIFISGQIPINPKTGEIVEGTITDQAEQVMSNIKAILEEAGSTFDNVVKTLCFLTDMDNFAQFNNVYEKYFNNHHPARSCIAVRELPKKSLCEIELVAKCK